MRESAIQPESRFSFHGMIHRGLAMHGDKLRRLKLRAATLCDIRDWRRRKLEATALDDEIRDACASGKILRELAETHRVP